MEKKEKPVFHKRIFWDVNFEGIDYDARFKFVIERVFERGDVDDIRNCRRYYGDEMITDVLLNAECLSLIKVYIASAVTDRPVEDFKSYSLRKQNP